MSIEEKTRLSLAFDVLVNRKMKGNAEDYAAKLGISRRSFFRLLEYMREELNAPLLHCSIKNQYEYEREGVLFFGFLPSGVLTQENLKKINGGYCIMAEAQISLKNIFASANGWHSLRLCLP